MLVVIANICIFMFLLNIYWKKYKTKNVEMPPELSGSIPLLGHLLLLFGDSLHCWKVVKWWSLECLQKGGVLSMRVGTQLMYLLTDPDDCAKVANQCIEKPEYYSFGRCWLGEGLFLASAKVWKKHRKLLNPAFKPQVINGFVDTFNNQARILVEELENIVHNGKFDLYPYLSANTLVTTFYTVLGEQNYVKNNITAEYLNAVQEIQKLFTHRFIKFWLHNDFIFNLTSYKKRQDEVIKTLHRISYDVLRKRKSEMATRKIKEGQFHQHKDNVKPFLDLLLTLAVEDDLLSDKEVREEVDSIIAASHDTIANVLGFIFTMLGSYPEVQERVYKEIQEVWNYSDGDLHKDDVHKLIYLDAVINETLRLYPTAPIVARHADSDVKLKNYTVPKDTHILLLYWGVHQHSVWGPDAAKFMPERWLSPATLPENRNAFGGFSIGRRNCIGKAYAMLSMKILLAHVIRKYKIVADASKLTLKIEVVLKPASGYEIALELRN